MLSRLSQQYIPSFGDSQGQLIPRTTAVWVHLSDLWTPPSELVTHSSLHRYQRETLLGCDESDLFCLSI